MTSPIKIKLQNKDVLCTFDKYGNIYFSSPDNPDELYDITITNTNTILCERYGSNYDNGSDQADYSEDINVGELVPFYNNSTLRGKIIKEEIYGYEGGDNSDSDTELNEDIQKRYFQEDLEYNEYINERDNYDEPYFSFNVSSHAKDLVNNLVFDRGIIHALYDTLVYEGAPDSANLIMKTTLVNDTPLYRLSVFTSGDIKFRPIGSNELSYKLCYDTTYGLMLTY